MGCNKFDPTSNIALVMTQVIHLGFSQYSSPNPYIIDSNATNHIYGNHSFLYFVFHKCSMVHKHKFATLVLISLLSCRNSLLIDCLLFD